MNQRQRNVYGFSIILFFTIIILVVPEILNYNINPMVKITSIFMISLYVLLSFELIHRTSLSFLFALMIIICMILFGKIESKDTLDFVIEKIDFNTIGLLLAMMIVVAVLGETGIFNLVGIRAGLFSGGNPWKLMVILCTFTAVTSMFVDNVTIILLMIPVTISIFRIFNTSPVPFILGQALASNIGGAATLIGDPPNIIIGSGANIDFNTFILNMLPTTIIVYCVSLILLRFFFKNDLKQNYNMNELQNINTKTLIKDKQKLQTTLIVLFAIIALFSVHNILHLEVSIIALGGAAVLLVVTRSSVEKILHEVDWSTLIFFSSLFVIVGISEEVGLIDMLSTTALKITGGDGITSFVVIIWLSAIASAFVDNIPFTTTMVPIVHSLNENPEITAEFSNHQTSPLWWALALGADLGGNGTLIGSSAGVVAAGISSKFGHHISFIRWFKIGFPFMLITVVVGMVFLYMFNFVFPH